MSGPGIGSGLPLAIAAALSFGMSGAWARGLIDAGSTPGAAVTVRIWVAAFVLLIPTLLALRGRWRMRRRDLWTIAAYGLLAVTATQLFYFQAVAVMDVGLALLIEYTAPIAVVLWLWLRRGEKPSGRSILGAVIALVGLVLMIDVLAGGNVAVSGVLWAFGAMVSAATYFVLSGKNDTGLPPIVLAGAGLLVGAAGLTVAGLIGIVHRRTAFRVAAARAAAEPAAGPGCGARPHRCRRGEARRAGAGRSCGGGRPGVADAG